MVLIDLAVQSYIIICGIFQIHPILSNENLSQNSFHSNPRKVCQEWNIDEMYLSRREMINSMLKRKEKRLEVQLVL